MDLSLFITALACLAALEFAGGGDTVTPFCLPGRLRNRPDNPHQFACDSGDRYIRIGGTEPETKYPLGPPRS